MSGIHIGEGPALYQGRMQKINYVQLWNWFWMDGIEIKIYNIRSSGESEGCFWKDKAPPTSQNLQVTWNVKQLAGGMVLVVR